MFFRCDGKFTVDHCCKNRKLWVLLVQGEEEGEEGELGEETTGECPPMELAEIIELSLNSVVGLTTPGTMNLIGNRSEEDDNLDRLRCHP